MGGHGRCYGGRSGCRRVPSRRSILVAMTEQSTEEIEISPERAAEMLASGEVQLIDVRQGFEWEAGRIEGAVHIPLETLPTRIDEIDRERAVIFQCRTGARSGMATEALRASGFEAYNLGGGLEAWVERGMPIVPAQGDVATARPDNS